jgi:hypothetical protein
MVSPTLEHRSFGSGIDAEGCAPFKTFYLECDRTDVVLAIPEPLSRSESFRPTHESQERMASGRRDSIRGYLSLPGERLPR